VWGSVDYLPWEYSPDGCFARSFYVSMEFASRGVPVNQLVLNLEWEDTSDSRPQFSPIDPTQPGDPPVTYQGNAIHWDYHIAALLSPPVVNVPTIFDKAMESTPVSQDTWIANVNSAGIPQSQADADGGLTPGYNEFTTYASSYVGVAPSLHDNWASVSASDLASMPAFQADQVQLACNTVWSVFDCMQLDDSDPRRQQLVDRTNALLTALSGMGLVQGFDGNPITCGPTSFTCAPQ
jgi:hypothetical protein